MSVDEDYKKVFIIGYGENINSFIEICLYNNKDFAIEKLKTMKNILPEFDILDYRIEVFNKTNNHCLYSGETIRLPYRQNKLYSK